MKVPTIVDLYRAREDAARLELAAGLSAPHAAIAPKFFYDPLGCELFELITQLDEYYPTRTEAAIVARHGPEIFGGLAPGLPLVELGAGSCRKAEVALQWTRSSAFVALEIAADFLRTGLDRVQQRYPDLDLLGITTDFSAVLELPAAMPPAPRHLFYPGSSIGNFDAAQAHALLRSMARACGGGSLVIGVDTVKDPQVLEAAYDDALGVTAAFNRNLLRHANRALGTDFDPRQWLHRAVWNADARRIELYLEARHALSVRWAANVRRFAAGERIHTENSAKWAPADFSALLTEAGFADIQVWTDARGWFAVYRARALATGLN